MPWLSVLRGWRLRRISTREYVENELVKSILKRLFEILNPGVVTRCYTKAIGCD